VHIAAEVFQEPHWSAAWVCSIEHKKYYLADMGRNYGVKQDVVVEKGEAVPYGRGQNGLELSNTETSWECQ
jgi:hypothetical protein